MIHRVNSRFKMAIVAMQCRMKDFIKMCYGLPSAYLFVFHSWIFNWIVNSSEMPSTAFFTSAGLDLSSCRQKMRHNNV